MISLSFPGGFTAARRAVFEGAAAQWDGVISTLFEPIQFEGTELTGVRIDTSIVEIDGASEILGHAWPTILRPRSELPLIGIMEFDQQMWLYSKVLAASKMKSCTKWSMFFDLELCGPAKI